MPSEKQLLLCCIFIWGLYISLFISVQEEDYSWIMKISDDKVKVNAWLTANMLQGNWSRGANDNVTFVL